MKKLITYLILLLPALAFGQAVKPDFTRTPNGPNTIVDWNVKFKTLILPHFNKNNIPLYQGRDTTGGVFVNTELSDLHVYVKHADGNNKALANLVDITTSLLPYLYKSGANANQDVNIHNYKYKTTKGFLMDTAYTGGGVYSELDRTFQQTEFFNTAITERGQLYIDKNDIDFSVKSTLGESATVLTGTSNWISYQKLSGGNPINSIKLDTAGIIITDNIKLKGLVGGGYYGANYTDNTYVQKKWVVDNFASATGYVPYTGSTSTLNLGDQKLRIGTGSGIASGDGINVYSLDQGINVYGDNTGIQAGGNGVNGVGVQSTSSGFGLVADGKIIGVHTKNGSITGHPLIAESQSNNTKPSFVLQNQGSGNSIESYNTDYIGNGYTGTPTFTLSKAGKITLKEGILIDATDVNGNLAYFSFTNGSGSGGNFGWEFYKSGVYDSNFYSDKNGQAFSWSDLSGVLGNSALFVDNSGATIQHNSPSSVNSKINLSSTGMVVTDAINTKGLTNAADYSANFTNESLVTKRWVGNNYLGISATAANSTLWNTIPNAISDGPQGGTTTILGLLGYYSNGTVYQFNSAAINTFMGGPFLPLTAGSGNPLSNDLYLSGSDRTVYFGSAPNYVAIKGVGGSLYVYTGTGTYNTALIIDPSQNATFSGNVVTNGAEVKNGQNLLLWNAGNSNYSRLYFSGGVINSDAGINVGGTGTFNVSSGYNAVFDKSTGSALGFFRSGVLNAIIQDNSNSLSFYFGTGATLGATISATGINITGTGLNLSTSPTTSSGGYEYLTRNTSTGAVEKVASSTITSGTYTPTVTNDNNTSARSASSFQYMRVGNVVTVSGHLYITPTNNSTITVVTLTLPIATTFSLSAHAAGTGVHSNTFTPTYGEIFGLTNTVGFDYISTNTSPNDFSVQFTYLIE